MSGEIWTKGQGFMNLTAKLCTKCNKIKATAEFHYRSSGDTYQSWCKECTNEYVRNKRKGIPDERDSGSKERTYK